MSEDRGVPLDSLTPADLRTLHSAFEDDVQDVWNYETRFVCVWEGLMTAVCVGRVSRCVCTESVRTSSTPYLFSDQCVLSFYVHTLELDSPAWCGHRPFCSVRSLAERQPVLETR